MASCMPARSWSPASTRYPQTLMTSGFRRLIAAAMTSPIWSPAWRIAWPARRPPIPSRRDPFLLKSMDSSKNGKVQFARGLPPTARGVLPRIRTVTDGNRPGAAVRTPWTVMQRLRGGSRSRRPPPPDSSPACGARGGPTSSGTRCALPRGRLPGDRDVSRSTSPAG